MAVVIKYIVVRNGVEKMTFTSKKEADAYDKMLDIADNLYGLIESSPLDLEENVLEDLSLYLAQNKDKAISILKGAKPRARGASKKKEAGAEGENEEDIKEDPSVEDQQPGEDQQSDERKGKKKVKKPDTAAMS